LEYISLNRVAAAIGQEAMEKLLHDFPGGRIYLHKNYVNREQRNQAILEAYDAGASREELSAAFGLSISTIDNIKNSRAKHNI
jgi:Mor family transcriptional regulator